MDTSVNVMMMLQKKHKQKQRKMMMPPRRISSVENHIHEAHDIVFEDNVFSANGTASTKAFLTSHSFVLRSTHLTLPLDNILSVSCDFYHFQILIHAYTAVVTKWVPSLFGIARRRHCCISFTVQNVEKLAEWKSALAKQGCYVNCRPLLVETKGNARDAVESFSDKKIFSQPRKSYLVILNPYSGHGHACRLYHDEVEPLFKWAGLNCEVIETNGPEHAQALVSSFDFDACPDGVVCVGGDGLVNEVLNGLHSHADEKVRYIPIGIIPAGSDNSLIWTIFRIRDHVSAALAIIKGHLMHGDIIAAQWNKGSAMRLGLTTFYHGFMSDVLELSTKYKRFGPLRYFVAGLVKMLQLKYYEYEIEYIPAPGEEISCSDSDSTMTTKNANKEVVQKDAFNKQGNWISTKGLFLGIIICNHQCKTVQCLKSQSLAPSAKHNDGLLDLLLVERIGLIRLLRFLILMQYGQHISLPFVKYIKVQCARLNSIKGHISCGIDGELVRIDSPVFISTLPCKMHLIGNVLAENS